MDDCLLCNARLRGGVKVVKSDNNKEMTSSLSFKWVRGGVGAHSVEYLERPGTTDPQAPSPEASVRSSWSSSLAR